MRALLATDESAIGVGAIAIALETAMGLEAAGVLETASGLEAAVGVETAGLESIVPEAARVVDPVSINSAPLGAALLVVEESESAILLARGGAETAIGLEITVGLETAIVLDAAAVVEPVSISSAPLGATLLVVERPDSVVLLAGAGSEEELEGCADAMGAELDGNAGADPPVSSKTPPPDPGSGKLTLPDDIGTGVLILTTGALIKVGLEVVT